MDIRHRFTGKTLASGETAREAAENGKGNLVDADLRDADLRDAYLVGANLSGADLRRADLVGAYLVGADLVGANLVGANLSDAGLDGANLRRADLVGANLAGANLRRADLVGANLFRARFVGANLAGVNLDGAMMNWQSHDLIVELLRRDAGDSIPRLKVAGLVLIGRTPRWCWDKFLAMDDPERGWALRTLSKYVVMGDDHPAVLDHYMGTTGGVDPAARVTVDSDDDPTA